MKMEMLSQKATKIEYCGYTNDYATSTEHAIQKEN